MRVTHGDLVMVREGYHPFVAAPGVDAYYLNTLAGSFRSMAATDDPRYAHLRANGLPGIFSSSDDRQAFLVTSCHSDFQLPTPKGSVSTKGVKVVAISWLKRLSSDRLEGFLLGVGSWELEVGN